MNIAKGIAITLCAALLLCACKGSSDETRLKRREIIYHFSDMKEDCVALFGEGAIRNITPAQALADLGENLADLRYIGIENGHMHIDLPWPYDDIDVPVNMEKNADALHIKGIYGKISLSFTAYAFDENSAVLRLDGKFCHAMPDLLKENVLANCIKNVVKKIRNVRD